MSETPSTSYPPLLSGNDPAVLSTLPKWNWGAFFLTWIWALGHRLYLIALIAFVAAHSVGPLVTNLIIGFLGNELAWKYRPFADLEEFRKVQAAWTRAGIIVFVVIVVLVFAGAALYLATVQSLMREMGRITSGMSE